MRLLLVLILLCLVAAGPAAAIAVGSGSVASPVKNIQAVKTEIPVSQKITAGAVTMYITTQPSTAIVNIDSVPAGAMINLDGGGTVTTPNTLHLTPGSHTIVLTLDGYQDYTTTINPGPNSVTNINAQLKPTMSIGAIRQNISAVGTISPGLHLTRIMVQATMTTPVPNTVCLSGEHCLTAADGALYYKPNWGYNVHEVCGYAVTEDNQLVPKYCTSGNPSPITSLNCLSGEYCLTTHDADATLAAGWHLEMGGVLCGWGGTEYEPLPQYCIIGTPKGSGLQPGAIQSVAVAKQITRIPVSFETTQIPAPGVTKRPLGGRRQIGIAESFFGLFGGLFQHPVCPTGQTACGGKCVDLMTDSLNCGSCDYTCFDPAACISGECDNPTLPQPPIGDLL